MDFEALVNEHKDAVYRQMLRVCGNREDAEDVVIDALVRAWRHLDQLQDDGAFRSWVAQIARRVCWNLKSRERLLPTLQLSAIPGAGEIAASDTSMETRIEKARTKELLQRALGSLPDSYQEVYRMRDLDELSGDEVARRLGVTVASMKARLHRARALLRERLDAELGAR